MSTSTRESRISHLVQLTLDYFNRTKWDKPSLKIFDFLVEEAEGEFHCSRDTARDYARVAISIVVDRRNQSANRGR